MLNHTHYKVYTAIQELGANANLETVRERLNLKSKNSIAKVVDKLVRSGHVEKIPRLYQTLRINENSETNSQN